MTPIEALQKIEQFSDSGDYATSIVKMKAIASEALASYKGGEDIEAYIVDLIGSDLALYKWDGDEWTFSEHLKKVSVPPYKEEVDKEKDILNKIQTTEFSKVYEDYSKKLESKEEAGMKDHEK